MARGNKFNISANKEDRTFAGIRFDSKLEMEYFRDVITPALNTGEIKNCDRQKVFVLQEKFKRNGKTVQSIDYVADFVITYRDGSQEVIDAKGMTTPVFEIKKKMFWMRYPYLNLRLVSFSRIDGGWVDLNVIKKGRKARKKLKENKEKKD